MGAVNGKDVNDQAETKTEDGCKEGNTSIGSGNNDERATLGSTSQDRIPPKFPKTGGILGLPVSRVVFTFDTIDVEDTRKQKEKEKTKNVKSGLDIKKMFEDKTKIGKVSNTKSDHKKVKKHEVAIQTEGNTNDTKRSKTRITELRIRMADSSEESPDTPVSIVWVKEKDSSGKIRYRSCKTWSDSDLSTWADRSDSLRQEEKTGQRQKTNRRRSDIPHGKSSKKTTTKHTPRVKFAEDQESDAESKDSDGKNNWSMSPRGSDRSSTSFAEGLKRKIQGVSLIKRFTGHPSKPDEAESDSESEREGRERVREENLERLGVEDMPRPDAAEGYPMENWTEDNVGERSPENPTRTMEAWSTKNNDVNLEIPGGRNEQLRQRCSDMGICSITNHEDNHDVQKAGKKENEERKKGLGDAQKGNQKSNFELRTPSVADNENTDKRHNNWEENSRVKKFPIEAINSKNSTEVLRNDSDESSEDGNEVVLEKQRESSEKIDKVESDSVLYSLKNEVGEEKDKKLGVPSMSTTQRESGTGQQSTAEVEQFDIKDQTVMAVFDIEYFWRAKYAQPETMERNARTSVANVKEYLTNSANGKHSVFSKFEHESKEEIREMEAKNSKNHRENSRNHQSNNKLRLRNYYLENVLNNRIEQQNFPTIPESLNIGYKINNRERGDVLQAHTKNESESSSSVDAITNRKLPQCPEKTSNSSPKTQDYRIVNPSNFTTPLMHSQKCYDNKCQAHASKSLTSGKLNTDNEKELKKINCFSDSEAFERMKRSRERDQQGKGKEGTRKDHKNREAQKHGNIVRNNEPVECQSNKITEKTREIPITYYVKTQDRHEKNKMSTDSYKNETKEIKLRNKSSSWDTGHGILPKTWENFNKKEILPAENVKNNSLTLCTSKNSSKTSDFHKSFYGKSKSEPSYNRSRNNNQTTGRDSIKSKSSEDNDLRTNFKTRNSFADARNSSHRSWAEDEWHEDRIEVVKKEVKRQTSNTETNVSTEAQEHKTEIFPRENKDKEGVENHEESGRKNELTLARENKHETNYGGDMRTHERRSTFLTLSALTNVAKNVMPKTSPKLNSTVGITEREDSNISMKWSGPNRRFTCESTLMVTDAIASDVTETQAINLGRANTKLNAGVSSSSITSSTEDEHRVSAKASSRIERKSNEAIQTKGPSSLLKTDYGIHDKEFNLSQLKRSSTSKVYYNSTSRILDTNIPMDENKLKPIARTSMNLRLTHRHETQIDKDNKHKNGETRLQTSVKSMSSPETRKMSPRIKNGTQFSDAGRSKLGNMTTQGPPHRRNVPRKANRQIKSMRLPQKLVMTDHPQRRNIRFRGGEIGTIETKVKHQLGDDKEPSRESKPTSQPPRQSPNSENTTPFTSEPTHKVTGKPPICAAPRKQRDLGMFTSGMGAAQAAMKKVEEWQVTEAVADGYSKGYEERDDMAVDLETMQTWKDEEFSRTSTEGGSPSYQKEALSIGSGAECSNTTRKNLLEGNSIQSNSRNKLILNNDKGMNEEISSLYDSLQSQSSTDGDNNANSTRMNMRKVSSKLSKLIENVSKLRLLHGKDSESKSENEDSKVKMVGEEEIAGQPNEGDGLRRERSEAVSVHYLRNPRPLSFFLSPRSNTTIRGHSDGSTSEDVWATGEPSTSSGEISMRTAERLQGQIDSLMEKFLTLLDNVERMQEDTERKICWEEKEGERKTKRNPGRQESIQNNGEESQLNVNRPLAYHEMNAMQALRKPEEIRKTSQFMTNLTRDSHGQMALSERSNSCKHIGAESKSGSSNSSNWSKMRIRSSVLAWCMSGNGSDHSSEQLSSDDEDEKEDWYEDLIIEESDEHHQVRAAPRGGRIGYVSNARGKKEKKRTKKTRRRRFWLRRSGKRKVDEGM